MPPGTATVGSSVTLVSGYEDAVAVAIQDDGAVVAAGEVHGQLLVLRFLPTGRGRPLIQRRRTGGDQPAGQL